MYDGSVQPNVDAGLADMIALDGSGVLEGISFLKSPGHSAQGRAGQGRVND